MKLQEPSLPAARYCGVQLPNGEVSDQPQCETRWWDDQISGWGTALVARILGREIGGKQNILVMNDEAHHAYRIRQDEPDEDELVFEAENFDDADDIDETFKETTV
jgi:hypothetical protein